jgi:uncharacterized protein YdeI (YjbR/CyaY-like superfamily)
MRPTRLKAFASQDAFRAWLTDHHDAVEELFVRCFKVAHAERGVTYRQALDEALCAGWIDGVRHAQDAWSFSVRFTPRSASSAWSRVNIKRYGELDAAGRVLAQGRAAFARRITTKYSYEQRGRPLPLAFTRRFRADAQAWTFFSAQPPGYQRLCALWINDAKRQETQERRFQVLLARSHAGLPIPGLDRRPAAERMKDKAKTSGGKSRAAKGS